MHHLKAIADLLHCFIWTPVLSRSGSSNFRAQMHLPKAIGKTAGFATKRGAAKQGILSSSERIEIVLGKQICVAKTKKLLVTCGTRSAPEPDRALGAFCSSIRMSSENLLNKCMPSTLWAVFVNMFVSCLQVGLACPNPDQTISASQCKRGHG